MYSYITVNKGSLAVVGMLIYDKLTRGTRAVEGRESLPQTAFSMTLNSLLQVHASCRGLCTCWAVPWDCCYSASVSASAHREWSRAPSAFECTAQACCPAACDRQVTSHRRQFTAPTALECTAQACCPAACDSQVASHRRQFTAHSALECTEQACCLWKNIELCLRSYLLMLAYNPSEIDHTHNI
jgi:hypothetical protein